MQRARDDSASTATQKSSLDSAGVPDDSAPDGSLSARERDANDLHGFLGRHRFLIVFAVLSTLMGTSVGMAKMATSLYAIDLHASPSLLGLIAASQSVGVLLVSMPIGILVDAFGPTRPFMIGSLFAGLTYALIPCVPNPWFLLGCTAVISCFMPMRFVSLNSVFLRELSRIGLGKAGWYRGTHMVGMMLLGPTVALAVTRALGYDGTYLLIALMFGLTIAVCPIVFGRYAEPAGQDEPQHAQAQARRKLSRSELGAQFAMLAREAELRRTCSIELAVQSVNAFFTFFIVVITVSTLRLGQRSATQLIGLEGGAFMLALLFFGALVGRHGSERMNRASFIVIACALGLLGAGRELGLLSAGAVLLGLGLGTVQIANLQRFAESGARLGRGKVSGLTPLVGTCGNLLGSVAGGVLGQSLGLQRVFLVYAAGFLVLTWMPKSAVRSEPEAVALAVTDAK